MDFYPSLPWVQFVWQKILWDLFCPPCFGSQGTEEPWEGLIWCYFSPTNSSLSDSKCLQKIKKKVNTNTWNENISPQSHTQSAVGQSRKDWQPKPSWWCPMSLKGSLGDLSMLNTMLKGKWNGFYCSFSPAVLSCLWLLSSETSAETEPDLSLLNQWSSTGSELDAAFSLSVLCACRMRGDRNFSVCCLEWAVLSLPNTGNTYSSA